MFVALFVRLAVWFRDGERIFEKERSKWVDEKRKVGEYVVMSVKEELKPLYEKIKLVLGLGDFLVILMQFLRKNEKARNF